MELRYLDPEHIQAQLRTFSGSEHFHRLITNSPSVMTDGVRWFINQCELYEVFRRIDEIVRTFVEEDADNPEGNGHCGIHTHIGLTIFQPTEQKDNNYTKVMLDDMDGTDLAVYQIPVDNLMRGFELESIKIWAIKNELNSYTYLLPSEY
jgi:hypothetical protein